MGNISISYEFSSACANGDIQKVNRLYEKSRRRTGEKINVNAVFDEFTMNTPLIKAVVGNHIEVVRRLLDDENVRVNCINIWSDTPLSIARKRNFTDIERLLLESGCRDDDDDDDEKTFLLPKAVSVKS